MSTRTRDLTAKQYADALQRYSMTRAPFGYVNVTPRCAVYPGNCGSTKRRTRLAWLLKEQERAQAQESAR